MDNFGNPGEALKLFQRACQLNPRFGIAWFFAGVVFLRKGSFAEALKSLAQAERSGHRTALVAECQGDANYNSGLFSAAAKSYELALHREPSNPVFESKLGLASVRASAADSGLRHLYRAREIRPHSAELHDRLILALVFLDRLPEAAQAAEGKLASLPAPAPSDFLRAGTLWAQASDPARAAAMLQVGLQLSPENEDLRRALDELARTVGIKDF
jgi:tetratricopeptide (TPR) repeat protein